MDLTYSQSREMKHRAGKSLHLQIFNFLRETFRIAIPREDRPAMSNCVEYMWLHERYAQALTSWLRISHLPDIIGDKAAEQERDATFRALSDHTLNCLHCNTSDG
jgi:hypothetical protein